MDKLRGITYFVHAVAAGGFSAAAKTLLVTPAAVSKAVAQLERELGVELLHRTTRHFCLSEEGAGYYEQCRRLLDSLAALESGLAGSRAQPRGKLTIGMPPMIARYCVMPALPRLLASYPELDVRTTTVFLPGEMSLEGVDVFFSVGKMADSQLIARKIAQTRMVTCASPDYLARAGTPLGPSDLARHRCLVYLRVSRLLDNWRFAKGGHEQSVPVPNTVVGDDHDALIASAVEGAGIVRAPDLFIQALLKSRRLVPILTDWHSPESPVIRLVYRKSQRLFPKVRVFVDWAADLFDTLRRTTDAVTAPPI
jgi:LysR family transcriptional regulator for bpeEF and oprC